MNHLSNFLVYFLLISTFAGCFYTRIDNAQISTFEDLKVQKNVLTADEFCSSLINSKVQIHLPEKYYLQGECLERGWTPTIFPPKNIKNPSYLGTSFIEAYRLAALCGDPKAIKALQRLGQEVPKPMTIEEGYYFFWGLSSSNDRSECGYTNNPTILGWVTAVPIYYTAMVVFVTTSIVWGPFVS